MLSSVNFTFFSSNSNGKQEISKCVKTSFEFFKIVVNFGSQKAGMADTFNSLKAKSFSIKWSSAEAVIFEQLFIQRYSKFG